MNNDPNQATTPDPNVEQLDSISAKRVRRDKWLSGIFVSVLVILCLAVACSLYILSKDYLAWSANKHKAQNELEQLQAISDKQRISIDEELKRLKLQKQERLNELATLREKSDKLNAQIAQRQALLSSTDEEIKQLNKIKAEAKNLVASQSWDLRARA
jgi:biopolymer transport protein ExbB/TolQ